MINSCINKKDVFELLTKELNENIFMQPKLGELTFMDVGIGDRFPDQFCREGDKYFFNVYTGKGFGSNKYFFRPKNLADMLGIKYALYPIATRSAFAFSVFYYGGIIVPNGKSSTDEDSHFCRLDALVPVLTNFIAQTSNIDAENFLQWVQRDVLPTYLDSPGKEPTERQRLEQFAELVDVDPDDLFDALIDLRSKKYNAQQDIFRKSFGGR